MLKFGHGGDFGQAHLVAHQLFRDGPHQGRVHAIVRLPQGSLASLTHLLGGKPEHGDLAVVPAVPRLDVYRGEGNVRQRFGCVEVKETVDGRELRRARFQNLRGRISSGLVRAKRAKYTIQYKYTPFNICAHSPLAQRFLQVTRTLGKGSHYSRTQADR